MTPRVLGFQAALAAMNESLRRAEHDRLAAQARAGCAPAPDGPSAARLRPVLSAAVALALLLGAVALVATAFA